MTRIWLAVFLMIASIAAAKAIPREQQIIIFGGQSSASGSGGGGGCASTGILNLGNVCNDIYFLVGRM